MKRFYEIGDVVERLTIIGYADGKYQCQCECGNTTSVRTMSLRYRWTKSCGCYRRDIQAENNRRTAPTRRKLSVGDEYGFLTIVDYEMGRGYVCKCVCGKLVEGQRPNRLETVPYISCGCKQKHGVGLKIVKSGYISLCRKLMGNYKQSAKRRGHGFHLTESEFRSIIDTECWYCGVSSSMTFNGYSRSQGSMSAATDYSKFRFNGIDRVDNNIGYTTENCVPCCNVCNRSKNTMSVEEWLAWVERLYNHQTKQRSETISKESTPKRVEIGVTQNDG